MSESLRDALEKLAGEWSERSTGYDEYRELKALLAAHPVEPAPVVTDEAVKAVREWLDEYYDFALRGTDEAARLLLEAAAPLLGPRPLLDRAAVTQRLTEIIDRSMETGALPRNDLLDAVMELARPMPTREQIAEALHDEDNAHSWRSLGICSDWCYDLYLKRAGAVLALLNGAG